MTIFFLIRLILVFGIKLTSSLDVWHNLFLSFLNTSFSMSIPLKRRNYFVRLCPLISSLLIPWFNFIFEWNVGLENWRSWFVYLLKIKGFGYLIIWYSVETVIKLFSYSIVYLDLIALSLAINVLNIFYKSILYSFKKNSLGSVSIPSVYM